jgi:uncharacterized membrane protein YeiH
MVLRRGFYAVPALVGAFAYTAADEVGMGEFVAVAIAIAICLGLRLPAIVKDFDLPRPAPE